MKYKLIASDFDGTIYTSDYRIADGTAEAIADYEKAGGIMMISTGRLYESIKQHLPALGLTHGAVIAEQGASVMDIETNKPILSYNIDNDLASSVLDRIDAQDGFTGMIYYGGKCYANEPTMLIEFFESIIQVKINYIHQPICKFVRDNGITPTKVLAIFMPDEDTSCIEEWAKDYDDLSFARSAEVLVEVVNKNAGKGNALRYIAEELYGIRRDEVITLGDSENDLSMIEYAGLGVAMGNAMDSVKAAADVVADTNDNSGVAKVIRKYGLGEEIDE